MLTTGIMACQALHKTLDDSMLPIAGGKLWSEHMLPNRPPGSHLDLKKSSFKKLSKFLKSRKDIGLLSCKEDKHNSEIMVTKVNRNHAAFTDYTPYTSTESTEELPPQVPEDVPSSSGTSWLDPGIRSMPV